MYICFLCIRDKTVIVPSNQSISSHGVSLLSLPHIMWMTTGLPKHLEMVPSQTTDTRCHTQGLCPGGGEV